MERLLVWRGSDAWRAEAAHVRLERGRLTARGTQIGAEPKPYALDYELETEAGYVTRRLRATACGDGWERRLELARANDGSWSANGDPLPDIDGALDCDLGLSPLTNTMPVLREGLLGGSEAKDCLVGWVSVPELAVQASEQRYEPVDARTVRYVDRDFTAELELDGDGFVLRYPELAERVSSAPE